MGKKWKGPRGSGKSGGGAGGSSDLSSARGLACVSGTCDAAREREANKELINLLNQALDELYPVSTVEQSGDKELSVQDALKAELDAVRAEAHAGTQRVRSINTGIKGFVLAKITDENVCPVKLVASIFERVRSSGLPCARHLVRIMPLQRTFYPTLEELGLHMAGLMEDEFNYVNISTVNNCNSEVATGKRTIAESSAYEIESGLLTDGATAPSAAVGASSSGDMKEPRTDTSAVASATAITVARAQPILPVTQEKYNILFNRRNHDVVTKQNAVDVVLRSTPKHLRYNYKTFQSVFLVEVFKNVCGVSYVPEFSEKFHDLNIRKYQASCGIVVEPPRKPQGTEKSIYKNSNDAESNVNICEKSATFVRWAQEHEYRVIVFDMDRTMSAAHCGSGLPRADLESYLSAVSADFVLAVRGILSANASGADFRLAVATGSDPLEYDIPGQSKETHILGPDLAKALIDRHCPEALSLFEVMIGYDSRLHPEHISGGDGVTPFSYEGKRHHMRCIQEHFNVPFKNLVLIDDSLSSLANEDGWAGVKVDGSEGFKFEHCYL